MLKYQTLLRRLPAVVLHPAAAVLVASLGSYGLTLLPNGYSVQGFTNAAMVYLVATLYSSVRGGLLSGLITAALGFLVHQYFFQFPSGKLVIREPYEFINLGVFVAAALITSLIGATSRRKLEQTQESRRTTVALRELYERLILCDDREDVVRILGAGLAEILKCRIFFFLPDKGTAPALYSPAQQRWPEAYLKEAQRVWSNGNATRSTAKKQLPFFYCVRIPTHEGDGAEGVLGVEITEWAPHTSTVFIHTLADHAAMAIERVTLASIIRKERELKEREELRSALLASVTHDLKTPLASVIGSLSSVRYISALNKQARMQLIATAHEEAQRLDSFISNILNMTKLESGAIEPEKGWHDPVASVHRVLKRLRHRNRNVVVKERKTPCEFLIDKGLIEQVVQNLIDNAVKYSNPDSTVTITVAVENGQGVIAVANEGPGIPTVAQAKLFDKFYRASKGDSRIAGTGLGLAICQVIMNIHGGSIHYRDAFPGTPQPGSVFTLRFPEAREERQPAKALPSG